MTVEIPPTSEIIASMYKELEDIEARSRFLLRLIIKLQDHELRERAAKVLTNT